MRTACDCQIDNFSLVLRHSTDNNCSIRQLILHRAVIKRQGPGISPANLKGNIEENQNQTKPLAV